MTPDPLAMIQVQQLEVTFRYFRLQRVNLRIAPASLEERAVLVDEINRATPRTQAALLEAMQERQVTVGKTRHALSDPFFVLATQNPLDQEGTYPLPEAQLDRFIMKILIHSQYLLASLSRNYVKD